MAGTFSQIYIQLVFAVQGRQSLISEQWEEELYKYISGIVQNKGQKMIAINGMPDHVHIFIGIKPNCCLSDLVREIKKATNEHIKTRQLTKYAFAWQEGYGAFSYSHSHIDNVVKYIRDQKKHHAKFSFKDEYIGFLNAFHIAHTEEYLFEWD